jgi:cation diffusion facilitator CzcD-associated flavoprotein CzcO
VIVGAGISGVGAAYHLTKQCPGTSFVVLDAKDSFGGTWLTHRYPGIRSDSDLYTFGYRFKPWTGAPIATAAEILSYMGEVIDENNLARHIRYRHEITSACWSSRENLWMLEATRTDTGESPCFTGNFLWMCQGYYRHSHGYTPEWSGMADYRGQIVHPQNWPEDLDYAGKNVVVIGSGSTAATLIPAIAPECGHVTMLQRSPTYFRTGRNAIAIADELRELDIDEAWIHEIVRRKILHDQAVFTGRSFTEPEVVKQELLAGVRAYLGPDYDMEAHFTPKYRPWRQRIAFVPDGDFLEAIRAGKASVVTDEIEKFTETGILLRSGKTLEADIIITATGFNLNVLGDIDFVIDGKPLVFSDTVTYRGMMFTGVPNMAWVFGYFRASWTLRADLVADFVCRLLNHVKEKGVRKVTPTFRPEDRDMPLLPWIDPENFNPGYLMRGMHLLPKGGDKPEWQHTQDYWTEMDQFPAADLDDGFFRYE